MFENSSIYVLADGEKIYKLNVDRETQINICSAFSASMDSVARLKEKVNFDINYKHEQDEIFCVRGFELSENIKDAIRNPIGVHSYLRESDTIIESHNKTYPKITAIFVGEYSKDEKREHFRIAFQKYRKEQNLVALPFRLFLSNDTFKQQKKYEIGITNNIDCIYTDEGLLFDSFHYARQIFDLRECYRAASEADVHDFICNDALFFENVNSFNRITDSYIRRKIAMINDSKVLENNSSKSIQEKAQKSGIHIKAKNSRIVIPADKASAKEVLAFLDEEAYRGPFSNDLLIANSKRVLRKQKTPKK